MNALFFQSSGVRTLRILMLLTGWWVMSVCHSEEIQMTDSLESLLKQLDYTITVADKIEQHKDERIALLKKSLQPRTSVEDRYWTYNQLYKEYFVFDADSAMYYVNLILDICNQTNRQREVGLWQTRKSFLLTATGLLPEAEQQLAEVDASQLTLYQRIEYYEQQIYLSSHILQYGVTSDKSHYGTNARLYRDSLKVYCPKDHPNYLWNKTFRQLDQDEDLHETQRELLVALTDRPYDTRTDAMNAYALSKVYQKLGDTTNRVKWLAISSLSDVRMSNKDIASLEELSKVLYSRGYVERAYAYITYCKQVAIKYNNRVRLYSISKVEHNVFKDLLDANQEQQHTQRQLTMAISLLSVLLFTALLLIFRSYHRLHKSQKKLRDSNLQLKSQQIELSASNGKLSELNAIQLQLNDQLKQLNEQLRQSILELHESNYVKEEYIGAVFQLCSSYINKIDEFRRNVNRKLKVNLYAEAKAMTESPTEVQNEIKEFHHSFDAIFLNIYPTFVQDLNNLLNPDDRIHPKEGEMLNTELRIYALVRMGITDSLRISQVLHCSPQTIYNYRVKTRSRALSKDDFDEAVKHLGQNMGTIVQQGIS